MNAPVFTATDRWKNDHPESKAALVRYRSLAGVADTPALAELKRALEETLKMQWADASKQDFLQHPTLAAYERYDRQFGQNYHVAMQVRSIAQKGKTIPARNVIIEAMFMTELATGVLAAAQDVDRLTLPITVDSADGSEQYIRYDGVTENCKVGDQMMVDGGGNILTSIAQGPTSNGQVGPDTTNVAYCFYFPPGVADEVINEALAYLDTCVKAGNSGAQLHESIVLDANQA